MRGVGRLESLEARRLFAFVNWEVAISGGGSLSTTQQQTLIDFVKKTGDEWAALIPAEPGTAGATAPGVPLRVTVNVGTVAAGSAGRLSASSVDNVLVSGTLFDQRASAYARYGRPSGAIVGADITLNIDPSYMASSLWFDPRPADRTGTEAATIEAGKIDAYSAILHEMGHAFFFNGLLDEQTYTPTDPQNPSDRSTFDSFIQVTNGQPSFQGTRAMAAYGGAAVPLTAGNLYHLGNIGGPGEELVTGRDLMNGEEFNAATRYFITPLNRAIVEDLITAGTRTEDPGPDPTNTQTPVTIAFSGNVTRQYTDADGTQVTIAMRSRGTEVVMIFAPGTNPAAPVGNPSLVRIFNADSRTTINITATGGSSAGTFVWPGIDFVNSSRGLGTLSAPGLVLTGSTTIPGVSTLTLGQVIGGSLTVGTARPAGTLRIADAVDANVTLPTAKRVVIGSFLDTDGAVDRTLTLGSRTELEVTAGLGGRVRVSGNMGRLTANTVTNADVLITGTAGNLTVRGGLGGSTLRAAKWGNVTVAGAMNTSAIAASTTLGNVLIAGAMNASTLVGGTGIGAVTVASAAGSRVIAGLSPDTTLPTTLGTTRPAFTSTRASLRSFAVAAGGTFSSTLIIAPTVGASTLGTVVSANNGSAFGVLGTSITGVRGTTSTGADLRRGRLRAPFAFTEGDFALRSV